MKSTSRSQIEAAAYYASKEAKLAALAIVPVNPKAAAAQKNAQPYLKAALDTQGMVAMSARALGAAHRASPDAAR